MGRSADILFASVGALASAASVDDIRELTFEFTREVGFQRCTCATVRSVRGFHLHEATFHNWPAPANNQFASTGLWQVDPVIVRARYESTAFFWDLGIYDSSFGPHQDILRIRKAAEVTGGCCAPVPERVGGHADGRLVLFLSGSGFERCEELRLSVQLFAAQVASRMASLMSTIPVVDDSTMIYETAGILTARERTVLSWVAAGKSSWEVAQILSISEHTVNTHTEKAIQKLDAATRTEAVARAIMLNQIDFEP